MMPIQGSAGVSPAPGLRAVLLLAAVLLFAGCGPLFQFRTSSAIEQNRLGRALSANADNVHAHYLMGQAKLDENQTYEAIRHFDEARRLKPEMEEAWNGAGIARLSGRHYRGATALYNEMAQKFPQSATAREGQAAAAFARGRIGDCQKFAQEALRLRSESPQALRLLGETSYALGEYDAAINYWDRAIQADPSLANGLAPVIKDLRMYQGRYGKK